MSNRIKLRTFTLIWLGHYHVLFSRDSKCKFPWLLSALGCASRISKWAEKKFYDPIPFIFERGGEGWGLALENYCELEKEARLGRTKIASWTMEDKHVAGLQAADLWAWELRHHFQAQLPNKPPYTLRESLDRIMVGIPDGSGFVLGGAELQVLMDNLKGLGAARVHAVPFSAPRCRRSIPKPSKKSAHVIIETGKTL